ncbi:AbrB/MazE/SpoVT family DNA-binding domain-containing protein [soil metagenome]
MRITSKGQVTIPVDIRAKAGLLPDTEVEFEFEDGVVKLRPRRDAIGDSRGRRLLAHLRGTADTGLSTDQIMALTRGD